MRIVSSIVLVVWIASASAVAEVDLPEKVSIRASVGSMPLGFTQNLGQWPDSILFRANAKGATMWFTRSGVYYQFTRLISNESDRGEIDPTSQLDGFNLDGNDFEVIQILARFEGANPNPEVHPEGLTKRRSNYLIGNDPSRWRTDVPEYSGFTLHNLYRGIDLQFTADAERGYIYQFSISAGGSVDLIEIVYEGLSDAAREYVRWLGLRSLLDTTGDDLGVPITGGATLIESDANETEPGFVAAVPYLNDAQSQQAVPLLFSTFLGGSGVEEGRCVAVDKLGNVFVAGKTSSANFPTSLPFQDGQGAFDGFVTKMTAAGDGIQYSTYLGGDLNDFILGIAVDTNGCAYVTGSTASTDFPINGPYQTDPGDVSSDCFVAKLDSTGSNLIFSTYIGGSGSDGGVGIAIDAQENVFVVGETSSANFPTENPYQVEPGDDASDVFVTKFDESGQALVFSTYLGGSGIDRASDIALDPLGQACITGVTYSSDFPLISALQTDPDDMWEDAFVAKFTSNGDGLIYSTYLGGSNQDIPSAIAVDESGNACIVGGSASWDFPFKNQLYTYLGGSDAFVTIVSNGGDSLRFSTFFGGIGGEEAMDVAVDHSGNIYFCGGTFSPDFPSRNPIHGWQDYTDGFVTKLSDEGSVILLSTFLGGTGQDRALGLAVDSAGGIFVTGYTESGNFPTQNAQMSYQGSSDVFVAKFSGDSDGDGWLDGADNCPGASNPNQEDSNGDGIGDACCCELRGDVTGDGGINVGDLTHLVNFLFRGGAAAGCPSHANLNGDGGTNVSDLTLLVNYLFKAGPAPVACP